MFIKVKVSWGLHKNKNKNKEKTMSRNDSIIHESTFEEKAKAEFWAHRHEGAGDPVNQPNHYKTGLVETIVSIKNILHHKGFQDYCVGNVVKYISRYRTKNGLEDLKKAKIYIEFLINSYEENPTK